MPTTTSPVSHSNPPSHFTSKTPSGLLPPPHPALHQLPTNGSLNCHNGCLANFTPYQDGARASLSSFPGASAGTTECQTAAVYGCRASSPIDGRHRWIGETRPRPQHRSAGTGYTPPWKGGFALDLEAVHTLFVCYQASLNGSIRLLLLHLCGDLAYLVRTVPLITTSLCTVGGTRAIAGIWFAKTKKEEAKRQF